MSRRQYPFHLIEPKWQHRWDAEQTFRAFNPGDELPAAHPFAARHGVSGEVAATQLPPKFYILDMFPYPSGAGLHVGHPEGYTATDILARYRRACGFNVLHPMGWDSFGLPAEQYAVKTGQHPRVTTEQNIANFTRQIRSLGFSYDWTREVATTDSDYFRWTQWIFLQLYNSWFNPETNRAEPISTLKYPAELDGARLSEPQQAASGTASTSSEIASAQAAGCGSESRAPGDLESRRRAYRDSKRLAYVSEAPVNWCPELGTVLANEEVIDGKSEVGGFPVIRKPMRQWMLRITSYAERLLADLDTIDWSDSLKEMQRNWIGRSEGAEVDFQVDGHSAKIRVFTTRPDTLFGATYMVLAPEHKLIDQLIALSSGPFVVNGRITAKQVRVIEPNGSELGVMSLEAALGLAQDRGIDLQEVDPLSTPPTCVLEDHGAFQFRQQEIRKQSEAIAKYREEVARKSDLERTELAKEKTGVFTGAYAINPVNGEKIPIWIADYVLASYGTGAIMAVPAHDERDWEFAKKFGLQITCVVAPAAKDGVGGIVASEERMSHAFCEEGQAISSPPRMPEWMLNIANSEQRENARRAHAEWVAKYPDDPAINGLPTAEAKRKITTWLEAKGLGKKTINYKLRDWLFSRQRYWGEPFPIVWKKDAAGNLYHEALPESALPLLPPALDDYKPTADGQPPLARAKDWLTLPDGSTRETNTMPQWAGSCWYYLRYLDAKNGASFVGQEAESYWMGVRELQISNSQLAIENSPKPTPGVDLYVGGTEHAVLHLLYARFWHKVLFDLGHVSTPEPFFKLVNQGLILGELEFNAFYEKDGPWISAERLNIHAGGSSAWGTYKDSEGSVLGKRLSEHEVIQKGSDYFLKSDPSVKVDARSFKMSKSRGNVVNPDDVLKEFGADAFRLYEMFMGPLQDTKPWNTRGVEGVYRFLGRVWRMFVDEKSETAFEQAETTAAAPTVELLDHILLDGAISDVAATPVQLKTLHACIKKVTEDLDGMRFNTAISAMMVFVNEAMTWQAKPLPVMKSFLQLLAPFAPHLAEELWARLHATFGQRAPSLTYAPWPAFNPALLVESEIEIPVSVNGKMRDVIKVPADADNAALEAAAKAAEKVKPFLEGKTIKKVIVVPKKMVNLVVG
jgi:leucyl-tRNA synthetase